MPPSSQEQDHVAPIPWLGKIGEVPPLDARTEIEPLQNATRRLGIEQEDGKTGRPEELVGEKPKSFPSSRLPVRSSEATSAAIPTVPAVKAKPKKIDPKRSGSGIP